MKKVAVLLTRKHIYVIVALEKPATKECDQFVKPFQADLDLKPIIANRFNKI